MFFSLLSVLFGKIFYFTGLVEDGNNYPQPLGREEEAKALNAMHQGDRRARDTLIRHNMRLVAHIVKKYNGSADSDDLMSVGFIGLIKAIDTFQEGKGTQLATYTARCIENEILMLLRAGKKHKNDVSLSDPVGTDKDGNELTLNDILTEQEENVFSVVEKNILKERFIDKLKSVLSEREYQVIAMRYGLEGGIVYPQREVASLMGISRSYISRIEKHAIQRARELLVREDFLAE